jgi:hypothetical protein
MAEEMAIIERFLAAGTEQAETAAAAAENAAESAETTATNAAGNVEVTPPASTEEKARKSRRKSSIKMGDFVPSLDDLPTGSVGLMVLIALFLVFAIVPAPGQNMSRLQLLWQAFLGNASFGDAISGGGNDAGKVLGYADQYNAPPPLINGNYPDFSVPPAGDAPPHVGYVPGTNYPIGGY